MLYANEMIFNIVIYKSIGYIVIIFQNIFSKNFQVYNYKNIVNSLKKRKIIEYIINKLLYFIYKRL